jgi:hypothetical protein
MIQPHYATTTERVADSYRKLLAAESFAPEVGLSAESQRALRQFFAELYDRLYRQPADFGLPQDADDAIAEGDPNAKDKKQEMNRKLARPRGMIAAGLEFLLLTGSRGRLEGEALAVENYPEVVRQSKVNPAFLKGMEAVGLVVSAAGDAATLRNPAFPAMMPALAALAAACARFEPPQMGRFQFARCDFRALRGEGPDLADLYRVFEGEEYLRLVELHEYFMGKAYRPQVDYSEKAGWQVQYQGDRKVKGTPFYQVGYDDRYAWPLRMQVKCAGAWRIARLVPGQSPALQEDFRRRVTDCRGDACGWCNGRTGFGPYPLEMNGVTRSVCWYVWPDVRELDDAMVAIIQEYEQMHAQLK